MRAGRTQAPAALEVAGALFFPLVAGLLLAIASCREADTADPRVLVLGSDTIVLPDSIGLVTIEVGRRDDGTVRFEPASVQAAPGDVVRFTALDNGSHAIAFDAHALSPEARAFLERTAQLRSPPLLVTDAAWVLSLAGAPAGIYPFTCSTHGERGRLTVAPSGS